MGIEPTLVAWEATVLPLNYARIGPAKRRHSSEGGVKMPVRFSTPRSMQILVNGEPRSVAPALLLPVLLDELRLGEKRLAVELNGAIVPRSAWSQTALHDGD